MSNGIRFDPLLVRHLAAELDARLRGRQCAATPVYRADLSVTLPFDRSEALRADLHPARGWVRIVPATGAIAETPAVCAGVVHAEDERWLSILIDVDDRFSVTRRILTLELLTNQWNAVLHEADAIVSVLRARQAGERSLHAGDRYEPPPHLSRFDPLSHSEAESRERWRSALDGLPGDDARAVLLREFAYVSALNVDWILAPVRTAESAGGSRLADRACEEAFDRWWSLCSNRVSSPCVLRLHRGDQPYPIALPGLPSEDVPDLLVAMERVADAPPRTAVEPEIDAALDAAHRGRAAAVRRAERLREELDEAGGADRLRTCGDLLLAHIGRVVRGTASVDLEDWEGESIRIPLDPTLTPAENAAKFYDAARRQTRAAARLPTLIAKAEKEAEMWERALGDIERGEVPSWLAEQLARKEKSSDGAPAGGESAMPYRLFRTSGGLEVRVGRSSRDNDRLTFRESSPNDVWLHARSVPGSHVILRWPQSEAAPPARDLAEAAQLAALFSRARTSSMVAVDWTRRKHVRKPRGAPAGSVVPQRVKTLFVEPDPAVAERLAAGGGPEDTDD